MKVLAASIMLAWSAAMMAQTQTEKAPITTEEQYDALMKHVGEANQAVGEAAQAGNWTEAAAGLAVVREAIVEARSFWELHQKQDALDAITNVLARIDAVTTLARAENPDPAALAAAMKEIGGACGSCHRVYRERLDGGESRIRPGSLD